MLVESPERWMQCRPRSSIAVFVQLSSVKVSMSHHTRGSCQDGACKERLFHSGRHSLDVTWQRRPVEESLDPIFSGIFCC